MWSGNVFKNESSNQDTENRRSKTKNRDEKYVFFVAVLMLFMKGITFELLLTRWPVYQRLTQTPRTAGLRHPSTTAYLVTA